MSKTLKGPKRTITANKSSRPDGRGSRYSVSVYKRTGSKRKR